MGNNVLISLIVPVYNSEQYLANTLESIYSSLVPNCEVIIINDGSTDSSLKIINSFCSLSSQFRCLSTPNSGVSSARNIGLKESKGDYVVFVDSDDCIKNDFFKSIICNLNGSDLYVFGFEKIVHNSEPFIFEPNDDAMLTTKLDAKAFFSKIDINAKEIFFNYVWNHVFKKDIIVSNNIYFNEGVNLGEDFLFVCDYLKCIKTIGVINKVLYCYYLRNNGSLSCAIREDEIARRKIMFDKYIELLYFFDVSKEAFESAYAIEGENCISSIVKVFHKDNLLSKQKKRNLAIELVKKNRFFILKALRKRNTFFSFCIMILIRVRAYRIVAFLFSKKANSI